MREVLFFSSNSQNGNTKQATYENYLFKTVISCLSQDQT